MGSDRIKEQANEAADRSSRQRRDGFRKARALHEGLARMSGDFSLGLDENGSQTGSRTLKGFHIVADRWYIRMGFRKEDQERLKGRSWQEIEARLKDGDVPRKLVRFDTHIVGAVRMMKHLRTGYQRELAQSDALLRLLTEANLALGEKKRGYSMSDITAGISALQSVDDAISNKDVAVKRIVARMRIGIAIHKLEKARGLPGGGQRDMEVSRALAVMVSVRNRLSSWRDRQVAGIVEHNLQKECALRLERDKWLFSQLSRFAEIPQAVHEYELKDGSKIEALEQMRKMLRYRKHKEPVLEFIKSQAEMFRAGSRDGKEAEKLIALADAGVQPKVGLNVDYQIGRLRAIYRSILNDDKERAREHIDSLKLFVRANKPSYILEELGKEPDPYLGPVLESIGRAVEALNAREYDAAGRHFAEARDRIRRFAYPSAS